MDNTLIFTESSSIRFATNTFVNVPTILQYESTPLIEAMREANVGFSMNVSIYHSDGTYLANAKGPRLYPTEAGKKASIKVRELPDRKICELEGRTIFELRKTQPGWEVESELFTPDGVFIRTGPEWLPELSKNGQPLSVLLKSEQPFQAGKAVIQGIGFRNWRIGILLKKNGDLFMGVR